MIRALAVCAFAAAVASTVTGAAQTPQGSPLTLEQAIARAIEANPAIAAAKLQRPGKLFGVQVAGERPNPELSYEASKETPRQAIGVSLPIELGGKRQRRIDVANAETAVVDADVDRLVAEVSAGVRKTFFDILTADQQAALADDVRALAARARDAASARVTAGDVPRSDLVQAELALIGAEIEVTAARGDAAAARNELNALMGQPPNAPLTVAGSLTTTALPSFDAISALALGASTELKVLDRQIAAQEARRNLAAALRKPDLSLGGAFTYDAEPEFKYGWRANFGVTLPLFTTHRAGYFVEDAELARLKAERVAAAARIGGAIAAALTRASSAREQATRYQTAVLPRATESERMAQDAYAAGQINLPSLIQALQLARESRQRGLQALIDYQRALADLERAAGGRIQ
jgi:outer membrane protein, heavy metal efflux system